MLVKKAPVEETGDGFAPDLGLVTSIEPQKARHHS